MRAAAFPISIDSATLRRAGPHPGGAGPRRGDPRRPRVDPTCCCSGVDRLDYTKGIRHRIKAVGELLDERRLEVPGAALVQVASPSRENVEAYQQLREEVELLVGRINGEHGRIGAQPIHYLHHSYPPEEMAALYLAADVMLVTSLRDGMNLVAKEFVAACVDDARRRWCSRSSPAPPTSSPARCWSTRTTSTASRTPSSGPPQMDPRELRPRMRRLRRRVLTDDVAAGRARFLRHAGAAMRPIAARHGRDAGDDA